MVDLLSPLIQRQPRRPHRLLIDMSTNTGVTAISVILLALFTSSTHLNSYGTHTHFPNIVVDAYRISLFNEQPLKFHLDRNLLYRSLENAGTLPKMSFFKLKLGKAPTFSFRLFGKGSDDYDDDDDLKRQQQVNYEKVQRAMLLFDTASQTTNPKPLSLRSKSSKFVSLQFRQDGFVELPTSLTVPFVSTKEIISTSSSISSIQKAPSMIKCLVLQQFDDGRNGIMSEMDQKSQPTMLIPLLEDSDWWLLQQQQQQQSSTPSSLSNNANTNVMTKFDLRRQNSIIINHPSNGLYDNLPYHWYNSNSNSSTQQPTQSLSSFGGKRECYNILLGKDWYLWNTKSKQPATDENDVTTSTAATKSLQSRIVQLQQQEFESQIAECDSEIAYLLQQQRQEEVKNVDPSVISSSSQPTGKKDLQYWQQQRDILLEVLGTMTTDQEQKTEIFETSMARTLWSTIQRNLQSIRSNEKEMPTPSKPEPTSTKSSMRSVVPYRNTYDMIRSRIIQDMLNADVMGILLENTSLLDGGSGMAMGGLIILQRKPRTVQFFGESIPLSSAFNGTINDDICFVECHVDEAIGMSLACQLPLWVAEESWKRGTVMCACNPYQQQSDTDPLVQQPSIWYADDPELMVLVEGQSLNMTRTERVLPVRIQRITNLYDSMTMVEQQYQPTEPLSPRQSKDLFPTDNIIQSLQQYDQMSIDDKARTFMAMSNVQQIALPRRRVVEQNPKIIDDLLIPYIDESVRYEFYIRTAQLSGDMDKVMELKQQQSMRSKVRMYRINAEAASDDSSVEYWDKEVAFYSSLRADVTQDVGSYSKFLDRDEWYERDRQRMVQRMLERQKKESEP